MIKDLIFDWSGTLVDDLEAVWAANNYVFLKGGKQPLTLEEFREEFELPFTRFYQRLTPHLSPTQIEKWFHEGFEKYYTKIKPLPDAQSFLKYAKENRMARIFILSSVHPTWFEKQSRLTNLFRWIDYAYTGIVDKVHSLKELLSFHSINPHQAIMIGDMEHDIEAAQANGIISCGILTGYRPTKYLRGANPDILVCNLKELWKLLEHAQWEAQNLIEIAKAPLSPTPIMAIAGLIFNNANQILLLKTRKWSDTWSLPGGKIEYGESSIHALKREVKEETGLELTNIKLITIEELIEPEEFYRRAHFVILCYAAQAVEPYYLHLNHESLDAKWVNLHEALMMNLNSPTRKFLEFYMAHSNLNQSIFSVM